MTHLDESDAHEVAGLVDGGVRRRAGHDLGVGHALLRAVVVAVRLGGQQDTLSTCTRHRKEN